MDLYVETEKVRHIIVRREGQAGSGAGRQPVGRWEVGIIKDPATSPHPLVMILERAFHKSRSSGCS